MQVVLEHVQGLKRRIRVRMPETGVEAAIDERLREIGRSARLKGFRPGRIPAAVIRSRYGTEVRRQVLQEYLQRACRDAIRQQSLEAVGPARIESETATEAGELAFVATFEVYPQFEVRGVDRLAVERPVVQVSDADVEELILRLRRQRRSWRAAPRPARAGDRVTIDYLCTSDGEPLPRADAQGVLLVLDEETLRPEFAAALLGTVAGDTRALSMDYPADFPGANLAGRTLRYELVVREIAEQVLPEADAAFCTSLGVASGELADLRVAARADMIREAARYVDEDIRLQLLTQLGDATVVELPGLLCEQQLHRLRQESLQQAGQASGLIRMPTAAGLREFAERKVRMGLIVRELFRSQGLRIQREEVNAKIAALCPPGENLEEKQNWYAEHPDRLDEIEHSVIDDKVIAWLLGRSQITDRPMSFVELVDRRTRRNRPDTP